MAKKVDYAKMTVSELIAEQERLSEELLEGNVPCNPEERVELIAQRLLEPDNPIASVLKTVEGWLQKRLTDEQKRT